MSWTRDEKYFASLIWRKKKSFKIVQAKFRRKFNFDNYLQKSPNYHWLLKFQSTGLVNNLNKKTENSRSGRKLTMWMR